MTDTIVGINYIVKTPGNLGGRARIAGRRIGVSDVVNLHIRLGAPLDEVASAYDLTMAQIHAALAYYYDHPQEIDAHLDEEYALSEKHGLTPEQAAAEKDRLLAQMKERNPARYERFMRNRTQREAEEQHRTEQ
jgi:uncharacterized protein (DUF433 family)